MFRLDKKLAILIAIIIILASAGLYPRYPLTIISADKVEIQPEGYVDEDNQVRGSFWVTTFTTDCTDQAAAWKFYNDTDRDKYYQGEAVSLESEIEIILDPEQPYWTRPLEVHSHQVYPQTYGTKIVGGDWTVEKTIDWIPSLSVNSYQFGARSGVPNEWAVHTPFWITLKKNGVELDKEYVDTVGMVETIRLENPEDSTEYVLLKNLGKLGTGYEQLSVTDIICIEKQLDYCFSGSDEVENKIDYDKTALSYSNYWFGGGGQYTTPTGRIIERWDDGSPAHYVGPRPTYAYLVEDDWFPGSYRNDPNIQTEQVLPIEADVWQDNPNTKPYGRSLVNYLKQYHNTLDVDVWKRGAEITDDNYLKINLPFSSVNSLVTLQISTELADTIVWKPQIANVKFVSCEWETGGTDADIADRLKAVMVVRQASTVKSTATIKPILGSAGPVTINPAVDTVDLKPDEPATVEFEFLNLGTTEDLEKTVDFVIQNTLGVETDRKTLTFTLKKKGVAATILAVYTVDAQTKTNLGGIPVTVTYDSQTMTDYTIKGTVIFDLEGVEATVTVRSSETPQYQPAVATTTVKAGQPNEVTLYLWKKGVTPPEPIPYWILIAIACAIVLIWWYYMRRRH